MNARRLCLAILLVIAAAVQAGEAERPRGGGGSKMPTQGTAKLDVPAHPFDVILCRPTATSITLSILCQADGQGTVAYGSGQGPLNATTTTQAFRKGEPVEIVLRDLTPDTAYRYRFRLDAVDGPESAFHTARPAGSPFTCTITADSHLDENTDTALYARTLAGALAETPDFHLDLGDTFMTEKHASREDAARQYLAQRWFLGQICRSAPLFFAIGNHDGESPRGRDGEDLALWSCRMRQRYFPNPLSDGFYTGNTVRHPAAGLLQDYYAWTWGDAQFIVLDPFWYTPKQQRGASNWTRTLGVEQYQWLKRTLETSTAAYRFVFIHHLVGGADNNARGGIEAAPLYEWGGRNADGSDGFAANRTGWAAPIHQLLVQNRVAIVFHGHDHLYAKQDLDGIVYQEVPQPGHRGGDAAPSAQEYGYLAGTILGCSGHMRLSIAPAQTTVSLVRSDGSTAHSYTIKPSGNRKP